VEYTPLSVSFVDVHFVLFTYNLCVKEYGEESKHAHCIRTDLLSKLKKYDLAEADMNREGKFVFVSDSNATLVAALRDDFDNPLWLTT